jgi:hypothetical protein
MDRRRFLKSATATGLTVGLCNASARAYIPEHNWENYDWGSGPPVPDRLYQGPFPQYGPGAVAPESDVVMVTTPSKDIVSNYGMGLIVYVSGDTGPPHLPGQTLAQTLEDFVKLPFVQKIYIRPNWRDVQKRPGRLDFPDWWQITFDLARRYNKRVGFRIMLENPDSPDLGVPDFLLDKIPYVKLKGEWKGNPAEVRYHKEHRMPRYDHAAYQAAFRELNALLAAELNGHPLVEFMDTMMYGFWGEGHTWPFEGNPFPNQVVAEQTWSSMFGTLLEHWTRVPLVTNTQPDFSSVGNSDMLDRTIRSGNWLRTDTIFIENTQIEALSNRPPWTAAICEVGLHHRRPEGTWHGRGRNHRQRENHLARSRCRCELSFGLELAQRICRQHPELLRQVPGANRRYRPPRRLPRSPILYLELQSGRCSRHRDRTREQRDRGRSRSPSLKLAQ